MSLFNFNIRTKKENNKLSFFIKKNKVSFLAYELLKKFVVNQTIPADKLDFVHPNNWKPKVLKNVSTRAMKTLYRLSDENNKNHLGLICQDYGKYKVNVKLSLRAKSLLQKIKKKQSRYANIDFLIKKYKINKILK